MQGFPPYHISPLGDAALLVDFGNEITEELNDKVQQLFKDLLQDPINHMIEVVPAYSSLAVYYDVIKIKDKVGNDRIAFDLMGQLVDERIQKLKNTIREKGRQIRIPVCYDLRFGPDLNNVSDLTSLTMNEIIDIHTSMSYRVYMLGFLPGFPYMGIIDDRIVLPRKSTPVIVVTGSVGIAGQQTGIYPLNSPGGWHIIGRTPVRMFMPDSSPPVLLNAGDDVQFYSIEYDEFESYKSGHSR